MQCPTCEYEAPVSAFGDPLRCPECGAWYEKAVQLRVIEQQHQRQDVTRAASHALEEAERVFYDVGVIKVTKTRFITNGGTFAMSAVNSVRVAARDVTRPKQLPTLMLVGASIVLYVALFSTPPNYLQALIASVVVAIAVFWLISIKKTFEYRVMLTTSSGEALALVSHSKNVIRDVEQALNDAIVSRG